MADIQPLDRLAHYILTEADAAEVQRRIDAHEVYGSAPAAGDVLPFIITKVNAPDPLPADAKPDAKQGPTTVNGQVILDGDDVLWVKGVQQGTKAGTVQPA